MRVLICDQESEMLETVTRWFDVDTATSKATCVDLMRANPFDVVIASERLSDGSGLELLSHVATRWPDTLRVLVIEQDRLRLLKGKLGPFRLHATMRYPIEEDDLERVLNRMGELMVAASEESEAQDEEPPPPEPPVVAPAPTTKVQKVQLPQMAAKGASPSTRGPSVAASAPTVAPAKPSAPSKPSATAKSGLGAKKPTSRSVKAGPPLGAPLPPAAPVVRRKLGNYTPLGSPEDDQLRIVQREFDHTAAPLAARAVRTREEASRPRARKDKPGGWTVQLRNALRKLLGR